MRLNYQTNQLMAVCYSKDGSSKRRQQMPSERLADGLTSIEVKVITAAFFFVGSAKAKRKTVHTAVSYEGKIVPIEKFG